MTLAHHAARTAHASSTLQTSQTHEDRVGQPGRPVVLTALALAAMLVAAGAAQAQTGASSTASSTTSAGALQPVVISGAAAGQDTWQGAATADVVDGAELRDGQLQINLSEGMGRVPGLVIRNRQNYAQDLQVSIRGYGARATFGVRGVRLFVDGIPASAPDGSGQVSNFPLGSADRIEVVRGPFSSLYGASSGGAILLYTQDGQQPAEWRAGVVAGPDGLWRFSTQATGQTGTAADPGWSYTLDVGKFATDGLREQSAADRSTANVKLSRAHEGGRTVLVFNRQTGFALDPQGLTRAEYLATPERAAPNAKIFNTRKSAEQSQLGIAFEQALGGGHKLELMGYGGTRRIVQFQSIPASSQDPVTAPQSSGGVIDLDRAYWGWNARWRYEGDWADGRLALSAGVASDHQADERKGFENFTGPPATPTAVGVLGNLRRNETNRADTLDPYVQAEWSTERLTLAGGLRYSQTDFSSKDRFIATGNPDDSGETSFSRLLPVFGGRYQLSPHLQAFASIGGGFETPTLNEAAYRFDGSSGLNTDLNAARSKSAEVGLRGRMSNGLWTATLFDIRTKDEIVVQSSSGGRTTFQNAGSTQRQGVELSGEWASGPFTLTGAYTYMLARYKDCATCAASGIPPGNLMPGLPKQQVFAKLDWEPGWANSKLTLEAQHTGKVQANDANTARAEGYTLFNAVVQFRQDMGPWSLREFVRIDNLTDRKHVGSVIVNAGFNRFYEPGPGRSVFAGVELSRRF
jgi:iron complex outermembrane recepter protein